MDVLTSIYRSGEVLRSRSVSAVVKSDVVDVPIPSTRILADWHREIFFQLCLEAGDIEALPLARTRMRWPDLRRCFDAAEHWLAALGLPDAVGSSDVALMASRGSGYHHDGALYGGTAFCNVFLSDDSGTDLDFPAAGRRIALVRGTAVLFDPCQPHAIIRRGAAGFDQADFASEPMPRQVFLTWELPIERAEVTQALGITFDVAPQATFQGQHEALLRDGVPAALCPKTGGWLSGARDNHR